MGLSERCNSRRLESRNFKLQVLFVSIENILKQYWIILKNAYDQHLYRNFINYVSIKSTKWFKLLTRFSTYQNLSIHNTQLFFLLVFFVSHLQQEMIDWLLFYQHCDWNKRYISLSPWYHNTRMCTEIMLSICFRFLCLFQFA